MNETQKSSPVSSEAPRTFPPCRHLRSKEMFYQGSTEDQYASGIYWCVKTQENMGPDAQSCSKCECGPERACYEA